jgi:hypothetical protein
MSETTAIHPDSILESTGTLETITKAARDGAADAREMANRVWANTGLFLCRFVYTTSYTLSYGVVFPAALIAKTVPKDNAAVRGMIDGARAASDKVHQMRGLGIATPPALNVE